VYDDGKQENYIIATAFQGLTPNGFSCLLYLLKRREQQCCKDAEMFVGSNN
jgi:hypothetical protein